MDDIKGRVSVEAIRAQFPALGLSEIFLDNAGGAQLPIQVIDRVREYMIHNFVQVGADYAASRRATQTVAEARDFVKTFMNANGLGEIVIGPSTSMLCAMLAECYAKQPDPKRNQIIVAEAGHEANVGPWMRLEERGYKVHIWPVDSERLESQLDKLEALLSAQTRIVALPHVSNLLGHIDDVALITQLVHNAGARVVIDGVAYAPHRVIDVAAWDVDWYLFSSYKVFGPHMAALFGSREALGEIEGPNHFFVNPRDVPYKMELGGVLHEGCAGILGIRDYLRFLSGNQSKYPLERSDIKRAFSTIADLETPLTEMLINYLNDQPNVKLIGPADTESSRVGTISFVHNTKSSKEIVLAANKQGIGIRYGHFYAYRLAKAAGINPEDGVVRTSLLHYNTKQEIERLIEFFDSVL